jgi:hypothetical protein
VVFVVTNITVAVLIVLNIHVEPSVEVVFADALRVIIVICLH